MPVHVHELIIRAVVDGKGGGGAPAAKSAGGDRDDLVRECVERVLEILAEKDER